MTELDLAATLALPAGGEVAEALGEVDWSRTPLGPPGAWPQSLVTALRMVLTSRFSMWMAWGPELTFFCNDAYRRDTLGIKFPWALGRPAAQVWSEIWDDIGPRIASVIEEGISTWDESLLLFLERSGYREETYHTFSYSPLAGDTGEIAGMLCVVVEETDRVIAERRLLTLQSLAAELTKTQTVSEVCAAVTAGLGPNAHDLPFSALYLTSDPAHEQPQLQATTGVAPGGPAAPHLASDAEWPIAEVAAGSEQVVETTAAALPQGAWDIGPSHVVVLPLGSGPEAEVQGAIVVGHNPHRPLDESALGFLRLLAGQISASLGSAVSFESQRRRNEALSELDQAKTNFFANVSHELRTPLTLIAGPIGELRQALQDSALPGVLDNIETVHRNSLRLGKLVNSLLEFSRLQAGRTEAAFSAVDLAAFTGELVGMFSGVVAQAGLELDTAELRPVGLVTVDADMWERIVLNLMSNAIKFTFEGSIAVRLRETGDSVELAVTDTGTGVPAEEVPRLFERFHRVEGARSRSKEGSGIGLALVSELVSLHGGTIGVSSEPGRGTTFTVTVPRSHPGRATSGRARPSPAGVGSLVEPFLAEAVRWLPEGTAEEHRAVPEAPEVLVVDDNADMRAYLTRLLRGAYNVRAVGDGGQALAAIAARTPDLVLSDVMMPDIDGLELTRRIRALPSLEGLPVILLTAQAGPESTGSGLGSGADDYLVKPFAPEDLLARVASRLAVGAQRRQQLALTGLADALSGDRSTAEITRTTQEFLGARLGVGAVSLALLDDDREQVRIDHHPGYGGGVAERFHTGSKDSPAPIFVPLRTAEPVVLNSHAEVERAFPEILPEFVESGVGACVTVPLVRSSAEVWGTLFCAWPDERVLRPADLTLVENVAAAVSHAVERVRSVEREHQVLQEFQERLLAVDVRATVGVVTARYQPAEDALLVGGDWYDAITLDDGSLALSVGDVVGKGLPAATVMGQLRSALGAAASASTSPATAMDMLGGYARRVPGALCATAVHLNLAADRTLRWSCAGHPPPVLLHGGDAELLLTGRGLPLGVGKAGRRAEGARTLSAGDVVLAYTDGLIERRGEDLDAGLRRLLDAAARLAHLPVSQLCDALLAELPPDGGFADDVAVLAVRVPGAAPRSLTLSFPSGAVHLAGVRADLRRWLDGLALPELLIEDVVLATSEACSNAIEHGCKNDDRCVATVEAILGDGQLAIAVADGGGWSGDSTSSVHAGRGRGFSIMKKTMDEVTINRSRLGTTVMMRRAVGLG